MESLKQENKQMRLELQKIKTSEEVKSDINSSTFDGSPSGYSGGTYSNNAYPGPLQLKSS